MSNKRLIEISLSFMLGISTPTLIEAISLKINNFSIWFLTITILLGIIGATIYYFLVNDPRNNFFFIYEITLVIYLTCWIYGTSRIISSDFPYKNIWGFFMTIVLFTLYGLWGLFYHHYEKGGGWKTSILNSNRVKFACLSIIFMIIIFIITSTNILK